MAAPTIPNNETERLQALTSLNILDTKSERAYDAVTLLAKAFFEVPIVAISLVDAERQWFKSIQGLNVCETSREVSFCGHTILGEDILVVEDALENECFKDNPLVTNDPKIRFYAGCPIKSTSGYQVGSLCIIDTKPRKFTQEKLNYLKDFVVLIEEEFFEKRKSVGYLNEIARIQEMYISNTDPRILFDYILSFLLRHTGSEYGFIGAVHYDKETQLPYLKTYAITNIAWNDETKEFYEKNAPRGLEFRNLDTLFGYTLKTGEQVISNTPKQDERSGGIPEGHPPLNSYLGMPIHGSEGFIAMYGLANREGGYNQHIAKNLTAVTQIMTSIIESSTNIATVSNMAKKDQLTGAYNRHYLKHHCNEIFRGDANQSKHAFMMLDFDNFKEVNDYYGHPIGDELLKLFVLRLKNLLKEKDFIARIGGDEFIIFLEDIKDYNDAGIVAERILKFSEKPYEIDGKKIKSTVSIGIACDEASIDSYDNLIKKVNLALYKAKKNKNRFIYYSNDLNRDFRHKVELEEKIKLAFKKNEFFCVYQPQYNIDSNQISGVEALIRWHHKESPSELIHAIESMSLAHKLNKYICNQVIKDFTRHITIKSPLKLAINLSLQEDDFHKNALELSRLLISANLPDKLHFEFEITEGNRLFQDTFNHSLLKNFSTELKTNGVSLAIDDFGTKQSSINRIIECNFNTIKIDKNYIDKLKTDQAKEASAVIKSISSLAKDLNMTVIAEGAEHKDQLTLLEQLGISYIQGNILSKPLTITELSKQLDH